MKSRRLKAGQANWNQFASQSTDPMQIGQYLADKVATGL